MLHFLFRNCRCKTAVNNSPNKVKQSDAGLNFPEPFLMLYCEYCKQEHFNSEIKITFRYHWIVLITQPPSPPPSFPLQRLMTLDNRRKLSSHFEPIRTHRSSQIPSLSGTHLGDVGCHRHTMSHDQIPFQVFNNSHCLGISLPNQP